MTQCAANLKTIALSSCLALILIVLSLGINICLALNEIRKTGRMDTGWATRSVCHERTLTFQAFFLLFYLPGFLSQEGLKDTVHTMWEPRKR